MQAASPTQALDASNIAKRLWVGSAPPFDRDLPEFDTVVLCAMEIQPQTVAFHGEIIRVPLDDACPIPEDMIKMALEGGRTVAQRLASGKRVLVTCAAGINRSALVAALGLGLLTRLSANHLIELIRARRMPQCLSNRCFQEILWRHIGPGRARSRSSP